MCIGKKESTNLIQLMKEIIMKSHENLMFHGIKGCPKYKIGGQETAESWEVVDEYERV